MAVLKIVFLVFVVQFVNSKPLLFKEVNLKKNFEFSIKPIPLRPIALIKEKWSPFGHFGTKHGIVKRSPFEVAAPLVKVPLEKSIAIPPISPALPPPKEIQIENEVPHVSLRPVPPILPPGLLKEEPHFIELAKPVPVGVQEKIVPPHPVGIPGPPPGFAGQGNLPGLARPSPAGIQEGYGPHRGRMFTDIARDDEINAYLKSVDGLPLVKAPLEENVLPVVPGNSIEPEGPKDAAIDNKFDTSSLVKGSRLALYFGNVLLQVMSEVISSARSAISQYNKPATI